MQEQSGIYGAIVIDEPAEAGATPMRDEVLLLSDWTDENPKEVMRALMTGNEWYAIRKKNYPSIVGAIEAGAFGEYLSSQWLRMAPMDISDVAYDAFLINGQSRIAIAGVQGNACDCASSTDQARPTSLCKVRRETWRLSAPTACRLRHSPNRVS